MTHVVAIHQPHFFPWMGYLHKMASADEFIILDDVQLTDPSPMTRNAILDTKGNPYTFTASVPKKGYLEKPMRELTVNYANKWARNLNKFIELNYKRAPFYDEVFPLVSDVLVAEPEMLIDMQMNSLAMSRNALGIATPLILQSEMEYDVDAVSTERLIALLQACDATGYLSGTGAKNYMDETLFDDADITLEYQDFKQPVYNQYNSHEFVGNLSLIDMLFNLGIQESREAFWKTVHKNQ